MLLSIFDFLGTVAFAFSGALVAMQKKLDLFGVIFLGITTAVGGGIFRDIILGQTPPTAFVKPTYCFISIVISIIAFYGYPKISQRYTDIKKKEFDAHPTENTSQYMSADQLFKITNKRNQMALLKNIISLFDAIGLATFTITGANLAYNQPNTNIFLVACMGLITGVGGGVLRDTFVQNTPLIFTKEIYAVASIIGAVVFYLCNYIGFPYNVTFSVCFIVVFFARMISIKFNINLPTYNSDKYKIYF